MPNSRHHTFKSHGGKLKRSNPKVAKGRDGTANWAGVPGATQPRNRAGGTKKLRQSPREVGI